MFRELKRHVTVPRLLLLLALAVVGPFLLFKLAFIFDDEPYRMTLKLFQGRGKVQFFEPGNGYVSEEFEVDVPIKRPTVVVLDSPDVVIPGGVIEFCDGTPGRFKIRLGGTLFDVMEVQIIVNGVYHDWALAR